MVAAENEGQCFRLNMLYDWEATVSMISILHGLLYCTWSQKRTDLGVHAVITADSIWPQNMTGTPCPPSWIRQQSFTVASFFPLLT